MRGEGGGGTCWDGHKEIHNSPRTEKNNIAPVLVLTHTLALVLVLAPALALVLALHMTRYHHHHHWKVLGLNGCVAPEHHTLL